MTKKNGDNDKAEKTADGKESQVNKKKKEEPSSPGGPEEEEEEEDPFDSETRRPRMRW